MVGYELHINNFIGLKDIVIKFNYLTVLSGNQVKDSVLVSLMVAFNNIILDYEEGKDVKECESFKKLLFLVGLDNSYDFEIKKYDEYRLIAKDGVRFLATKGKQITAKVIMFNDETNELFKSLYVKQNSGIVPCNTFGLDVRSSNRREDVYAVKTNVFNGHGWEVSPYLLGDIVIDDPIVGKTIYASLLSSILDNENYDTLFTEIAYSIGSRCIVLNDIYKYFDDDTYQMLLERILSFVNSDSKNSIVITDSSNTISYYLNLYLEANNTSKQVGDEKVSKIIEQKYWLDLAFLSYYYINEETGGLHQVKNKITNLLDIPQNCYVDDSFDKLLYID